MATKMLVNPAQADELLSLWEQDAATFARGALGMDPWRLQEAILRALAKPRARVAVKACHSSGKTEVAAAAILWWTALGGKTISTAPTWTQVERLMWGAVARLYTDAVYPLGGNLNKTSWEISPDNYAMGLSTNEGVRFQGWHGQVLIILDEAAGVRPDIYESIEGIRAGGDVRILAIGNPVIPSGPFYDAFATNRAGWTTFTIDAFDTPNLTGLTPATLRDLTDDELDLNPRPYLTTRRWVREKLEEWGEDSPAWQSRVRGQFPTQSADSLIALAWLEGAAQRPPVDRSTPTDDTPPVLLSAGIDVAGPGESETSLCLRCGPSVLLQRHWTKAEAVGDCIATLRPYQARLGSISVDVAGNGYHFATQIRDAFPSISVRFVNVGEGVDEQDRERYMNLKARLYWSLRERLRKGDLHGLTDPQTIGQLASIRYATNSRGQIVIEKKEDAAKRGIASPDRAEAVMLAFAAATVTAAPAVTTAQSSGRRPTDRWKF